MELIIAEKPNQAKDIAAAILKPGFWTNESCLQGYSVLDGGPITVAYCTGHLLEQCNPEDYDEKWRIWAFDRLPIFPKDDVFKLQPRDAAAKRALDAIRGYGQEASEIINACDAGREGELIFWEVARWNGLDQKKPPSLFSRMWIQDPTVSGLQKAYAGRQSAESEVLKRLRDVAFLRSQSDWLFGFNMSRYVTLAIAPHPHFPVARHGIGRVQTSLLGVIHDRSEQVANFESSPFYKLHLSFLGSGGHFKALLVARKEEMFGAIQTFFKDYEVANERARVIYFANSNVWTSLDNTPMQEQHPPAPFSLVELQRSCFRIYGWSAQYTLKIAQNCYAKDKTLTYPRTESRHLPLGMKRSAWDLRNKLWREHILKYWPATEKLPPYEQRERFFKEDDKMEEHHAIIPTGIIPVHMGDHGKVRHEYLLWDLVVRRFVMSMLPPTIVANCERILEFPDPKNPGEPFTAKVAAEPLIDPGWLVVEDIIGGTKGYGKSLAEHQRERWVECDGKAELLKVDVTKGYTERPLEFTDDTILATMLKLTLGTAATRGEMVEKLVDRGYVERSKSGFLSTLALGSHLVSELRRLKAHDLLSPEVTSQWEKAFDDIQSGAVAYEGPVKFMGALKGRIVALGTLLQQQNAPQLGDETVYCPSSFAPVVDQGNFYIFKGYPKIPFPKVYRGRPMKAKEWRDILTANPKTGAGPFDGFVGGATGRFSTSIAFLAKKGKFGHFKFVRPRDKDAPKGVLQHT